jgi:hypothetical protein
MVQLATLVATVLPIICEEFDTLNHTFAAGTPRTVIGVIAASQEEWGGFGFFCLATMINVRTMGTILLSQAMADVNWCAKLCASAVVGLPLG